MNKFAEFTADGERLDLPLSQALLAADWHLVAAPIRAVHERRPVTLLGRATVVRGWGWLPRLCGWLSGLPDEQHNGPIKVVLEQTRGGKERWTRYFGGARPLQSDLRRSGDCVVETIGVTTLRFKFCVEGGSIRWTAVGGRTLGLPWPRSWLKGIDGYESHRRGRYYFNVRAALPWFGLIVHYVGELDLVRA
jgi:hypothetical protein